MTKPLTLINDPIHGVMVFEEKDKKNEARFRKMFKELCDHEYFQRLRRIKQLGGADLVFPGASHTRFNHSLGVCYLAIRIANRLKLPIKQKEFVMVAALLHDIGHGPLSHAFERLLKSNEIKHDNQWLKEFLRHYNKAPLTTPKSRNEIESLISSSDEIKISEEFELLRDIISANLDADRLDYLIRDSHFCGVPYGKIDLEWIISCIEEVTINKKKKRIAINCKGIGALEDFLCARRLMTKNIYYHGKIKAAEYYIDLFLRELTKQLVDNKSQVNKSLPKFKESTLGIFLKRSSDIINNIKLNKKELNKYISDAFKQYSQLTDDDIWLAIRNIAKLRKKDDCREIARKLLKRELPQCCKLDCGRIKYTKKIIDEISTKRKIKPWKLHIEELDMIPYKHEKSPILITENNGGFYDLFHESTLLNFLSDKKEYNYYLFISNDLSKKLKNEIFSKLNKFYCFATPEERKTK